MNTLIKYYSRKDVQRSILEASKNREVAANFNNTSYSKRPDVLQFENDVYEFVRKGATSFHVSEERWNNPLLIKTGMSKNELDNLRQGWDLIFDVDGLDIEYSKLASYYILEALKFYDIKNISVKFSGNKGFHIAVPFETFPGKINNIEIKNFFPEGPRIIANYLRTIILEHLSNAILEKESINEIAEKLNKEKNSLIKNNLFDPFNLVNIDSILISSRHLFRAPYSLNEKSGLVSIPIKLNNILNFDKNNAKVENIETTMKFLDVENIKEKEATELFDKALYWNLKTTKKTEEVRELGKRTYDLPKTLIHEEFFPPCIKILSKGVQEDGRKRALFILLNFLKSINYNEKQIEDYILNWNQRNKEPLKEGYVKAQLTWQKRQNKIILPPNCPKRENNVPLSNQQNYYIDLEICKPDDFCKLIKNPVNYAIRKQKVFGKE